MVRTVHKLLTILVIALGLLHVLFTFHDYDEFSLDALWFASAGVAIVLAGFLNVILWRDAGKDKVVQILCMATNLVFALMFISALTLMLQPQVVFGLMLFATISLVSVLVARNQQ